jgi:ABC-type antimicrobial peptide transport system permease subunit
VPDPSDPWGPWPTYFGEDVYARSGIEVDIGSLFERARLVETDDDFLIFDLILLLTAFLAAVGIANNLVLSAHVRRREIALYRTLGMRVGQIRSLFVMEGTLIGALGGTMAVVLGIPLGLAVIGALAAISAFEVQFVLPPTYAVYTIAAAVVISLASAVYPAFAAARVSSAESIHYE